MAGSRGTSRLHSSSSCISLGGSRATWKRLLWPSTKAWCSKVRAKWRTSRRAPQRCRPSCLENRSLSYAPASDYERVRVYEVGVRTGAPCESAKTLRHFKRRVPVVTDQMKQRHLRLKLQSQASAISN